MSKVVDARLRDRPVPRVSVAQMERGHVAREKRMKGSRLAFLDQRLPAHERENISIIGMGVTENITDPDLAPKIAAGAYGFAVGYIRAENGKGAALHRHPTEEIFTPIRGDWEIYWLEGEVERSVKLGPGDIVNVPIGIYRGFRGASDDPDALLFAAVGGPDTGRIDWHPSVIEAARRTGLAVDAAGNLLEGSAATSDLVAQETVDLRLRGRNVPRISAAAMEKSSVARVAAMKGSAIAFVDQRIPGHEREIIDVIGMGVTENAEDPNLAPKIATPAHGFAVTYIRAGKGKGAALHRHPTEEVFTPIKGTWEVFWMEGDMESAVALEPGDIVNVPIGIFRGFRNVSDHPDALLLALIGGPDPGKVDWHPKVIADARATGLAIDDDGNLIVATAAQ
ncbi:MAG: cupin domain-containing protein [Alphaproteobacteria bacterium]|nr:cupin domain-containing protein [Alphaproteobacteria bacterium]